MSDIATPGTTADEHGHDSGDLELPNGRPAPAPLPHEPRRADVDPKAARRAERQVSTMFIVASLLFLAFLAAYIGIDKNVVIALPVIGTMSASNLALGLTLGLALFLIGAGAIHWAKKLMPDIEVVQERHVLESSPTDREEAISVFEAGATESGFGSRKIIRRSLITSLVLLPLPLVIILRDMWVTPTDSPSPNELLSETIWTKGERIVTDGSYRPIRPEDIPVGGLVNVVPASLEKVEEAEGTLNERAKAASILVRMTPAEIRSQQGGSAEEPWDVQGILAFSKICTHVGCPISLYQQRTHQLLCPCHQSTFDLADSAKVVFGPAARRMPQLPITVDSEGYLVARSDFQEHVGPSFWEQGAS
ncbi:MAG: Rieske 2Fe-2S domain-containing protein [Actinomycetes bacterium]